MRSTFILGFPNHKEATPDGYDLTQDRHGDRTTWTRKSFRATKSTWGNEKRFKSYDQSYKRHSPERGPGSYVNDHSSIFKKARMKAIRCLTGYPGERPISIWNQTYSVTDQHVKFEGNLVPITQRRLGGIKRRRNPILRNVKDSSPAKSPRWSLPAIIDAFNQTHQNQHNEIEYFLLQFTNREKWYNGQDKNIRLRTFKSIMRESQISTERTWWENWSKMEFLKDMQAGQSLSLGKIRGMLLPSGHQLTAYQAFNSISESLTK